MSALELRIPPPLVAFGFFAIMWLFDVVEPGAAIMLPGLGLVGFLLAILGGLAATLAIVSFRRTGTTVNPFRPHDTAHLVEHGIFAVTRNPMYLALALLLTGWALWLGNATLLILVLAFVLYIDRYQIRPEERVLGDKFGERYHDYRRRVRRWI